LCINKYVLTGEIADVSDALKRLLEVDIQSRANPAMFVDGNVFRRAHCYMEDPSMALMRNRASLQNLFDGLSAGEGAIGIEGSLLSLAEWKTFMRGLGMISVDVTERETTLCFAWSRMVVADARTRDGNRKESNLPFEGFLEALVRLSALKALPTDEEIEAAQVANAAEFMHKLQLEDPVVVVSAGGLTYHDFLEKHAAEWGGEPRQPIARCLEHLVIIIFDTIEQATSGGGADGVLSVKEVRQWCETLPAM